MINAILTAVRGELYGRLLLMPLSVADVHNPATICARSDATPRSRSASRSDAPSHGPRSRSHATDAGRAGWCHAWDAPTKLLPTTTCHHRTVQHLSQVKSRCSALSSGGRNGHLMLEFEWDSPVHLDPRNNQTGSGADLGILRGGGGFWAGILQGGVPGLREFSYTDKKKKI